MIVGRAGKGSLRDLATLYKLLETHAHDPEEENTKRIKANADIILNIAFKALKSPDPVAEPDLAKRFFYLHVRFHSAMRVIGAMKANDIASLTRRQQELLDSFKESINRVYLLYEVYAQLNDSQKRLLDAHSVWPISNSYLFVNMYAAILDKGPLGKKPFPDPVIPLVAYLWYQHHGAAEFEEFEESKCFQRSFELFVLLTPTLKQKKAFPESFWHYFEDDEHLARTMLPAFERTLEEVNLAEDSVKSRFIMMMALLDPLFDATIPNFERIRLELLRLGVTEAMTVFLCNVGDGIQEGLEENTDPDPTDTVVDYLYQAAGFIEKIAKRQDGWVYMIPAIRDGLLPGIYRIGMLSRVSDHNLYYTILHSLVPLFYKRRAYSLLSHEMMLCRAINEPENNSRIWTYFEHLFFRYDVLRVLRDVREDALLVCCANVSSQPLICDRESCL